LLSKTPKVERELNGKQNVDRLLRANGLRGWEDVYSIRSYHVDASQSFQPMVDLLKERLGHSHRPIWTVLGVKELALPAMKVEIEVEAHKG